MKKGKSKIDPVNKTVDIIENLEFQDKLIKSIEDDPYGIKGLEKDNRQMKEVKRKRKGGKMS